MSILLLPFIIGSLYFLIPGAILGVKGILCSQSKLFSIVALSGLSVAFHAIEFCAPFLVAKGQSVNQGALFLFVFGATIVPATAIGSKLKNNFRVSESHQDAIVGSALYISAGVTTFSWFSFSKSLGSYMAISWTF